MFLSQKVCAQTVPVDSCFSSNKIRVKKLVVRSLIYHLTLQATWGLPYPIHSALLMNSCIAEPQRASRVLLYTHHKSSHFTSLKYYRYENETDYLIVCIIKSPNWWCHDSVLIITVSFFCWSPSCPAIKTYLFLWANKVARIPSKQSCMWDSSIHWFITNALWPTSNDGVGSRDGNRNKLEILFLKVFFNSDRNLKWDGIPLPKSMVGKGIQMCLFPVKSIPHFQSWCRAQYAQLGTVLTLLMYSDWMEAVS